MTGRKMNNEPCSMGMTKTVEQRKKVGNAGFIFQTQRMRDFGKLLDAFEAALKVGDEKGATVARQDMRRFVRLIK